MDIEDVKVNAIVPNDDSAREISARRVLAEEARLVDLAVIRGCRREFWSYRPGGAQRAPPAQYTFSPQSLTVLGAEHC